MSSSLNSGNSYRLQNSAKPHFQYSRSKLDYGQISRIWAKYASECKLVDAGTSYLQRVSILTASRRSHPTNILP